MLMQKMHDTLLEKSKHEDAHDNGTSNQHAPTCQSHTDEAFAHHCAHLNLRYGNLTSVLLIQTPQFLFENFDYDIARAKGYYAYPPTGLQWIASALEEYKVAVDILDLNYEILRRVQDDKVFEISDWMDILDEYLASHSPQLIGITSISAFNDFLRPNHPLTWILRHLRKSNKHILLCGGTTATNEYEQYLLAGLCDIIITGEGEQRMRCLVAALQKSQEMQGSASENQIDGIFFAQDGKVCETHGKPNPFPLKRNLNSTYATIPVEKYHEVGCLNPFSRMAGQNIPYGVIQLNRGCRANCKFCGVSKYLGRGARHNEVKCVADELTYLISRGIRHFEILDDDFLANKEAVSALLTNMVELREQFGITWSANNGLIAGSITQELLSLMDASGCLGFKIGIESGNPQLLKTMRKPASHRLLLSTSALLQKHPALHVGGNYILGMFGEETFGQMLDTFSFAHSMGLDWSSYTTFQFTSKDTLLQEHLKHDGRITSELIPPRDSLSLGKGNLSCLGPEIFHINEDSIPGPDSIKDIWFAFNLASNYILNKNLRTGGNPEKFTSWIEAVRIVYPKNPYMPLFLGLGYSLLGKQELASRNYDLAASLLGEAGGYWHKRFDQFGLLTLLAHPPVHPDQVRTALGKLALQYTPYLDWEGRIRKPSLAKN
jgi:radical SAM superfamily enzyme YgiQ (UPF0313 family)